MRYNAIRLRMERFAPKNVQFAEQPGDGDPAPPTPGRSVCVFRCSGANLAADVAPEERKQLRVKIQAVLFVVEPVQRAGLDENAVRRVAGGDHGSRSEGRSFGKEDFLR